MNSTGGWAKVPRLIYFSVDQYSGLCAVDSERQIPAKGAARDEVLRVAVSLKQWVMCCTSSSSSHDVSCFNDRHFLGKGREPARPT